MKILNEQQLLDWIQANKTRAREYTGNTSVMGLNDLGALFKGMMLVPADAIVADAGAIERIAGHPEAIQRSILTATSGGE